MEIGVWKTEKKDWSLQAERNERKIPSVWVNFNLSITVSFYSQKTGITCMQKMYVKQKKMRGD